jgi:uncharacterized protein involved in outer membrane biogenesis
MRRGMQTLVWTIGVGVIAVAIYVALLWLR